MATKLLNRVVAHLRHSALKQAAAELCDGDLLESYIGRRDEAAFEALVRRHGPMVLGVCKRVLRNHADAEDAFQATFLVLVRRARSIRRKGAVANWLYGVAHNTALKARIMNRRRRTREIAAGTMSKPHVPEQSWDQLQGVIDSELSLLRDKYRIPIVVCDLEGKTIKEAAAHLGWPQGTVATRLRRGRSLLAARLAKRGVALSAAALAGTLSTSVAPAAVPPLLLGATVRAAGLLGAGQTLLAGGVSIKVAALTEGVLKAMLLSKLKGATAVVLVLAVLGLSIGGVSHSADPNGKEALQIGQDPRAEAGKNPKAADTRAATLLISTEESGMIVYVIKAGDKVGPGTVLARLDDRAAKAEVERAQARVDVAKAEHAAAAAQVGLAMRRAERMQKLVEQKAVEQAVYDEAVSTRDRFRAELEAKKAVVAVTQAEAKYKQLLVAKLVLSSPVAGTVGRVFRQPGEFVKAGERLLEIAPNQSPAKNGERNATDDARDWFAELRADAERLRERMNWAERMAKLGFMSQAQVQADRDQLRKTLRSLARAHTSLEALTARFRYRVPVETGYTEFAHGGRVTILEIWGTRPKIEVGGQYLVRGTYAMPAHDDGTLYFYLTGNNWNPKGNLDLQKTAVKKGQGEFTLLHGMDGPGSFHLQLIANDRDRYVPIANVYFGTGDNVWHKRP